ncbi:MAG: tRNA preQ1(34) S-adenosylmethionine ribosyltransferase-isomerase QueA [Mariprofundaceae bacterium]|nr:tRNA preQ1(34) S-adenosylmethionine ribosyltransferase-isomerase QueA [Mariprofundaceae bacterium]
MKGKLRLSDFDFSLPEGLIAKHPLPERDASRLLHVTDDGLLDRTVSGLAKWVQAGDLWVINNTRVIPARLLGQKNTGGKVEILLLEPLGNDHQWLAWGKSNKPLKTGDIIHIADDFDVQVLEKRARELVVKLLADNVPKAIQTHGHMPLPPYITRPDEAEDKTRYQTVFARHDGAVAAPTAGLHLTVALMDAMRKSGANFVEVTLHVGAGTFQPIQAESISEHQMHEESYHIHQQAADAINNAKSQGRRIVAVGTTSLRCLESSILYGNVIAGAGRSRLFIYPGYDFQVVDALLTNFHLPRSTLLMLVSAFAGMARIREVYAHAMAKNYRFFSYGDAMFCERLKIL